MKRNQRWIRDQRREGRKVIDIGPAFPRRARRAEQGIRPDSEFYNMERQELEGYENYVKHFNRQGKYQGGVPGLDF